MIRHVDWVEARRQARERETEVAEEIRDVAVEVAKRLYRDLGLPEGYRVEFDVDPLPDAPIGP